MSDSVVDEQLLEELTRRYEPPVVPACRTCGAPLEVVACGGGSPTRYACSTQTNTLLPVDWQHYEASRGEDRRQGGDQAVMQLIAAYRALQTPASPIMPRLSTGRNLRSC
ncbi:hypothetical protein [Variovorax sp. JS1663]|uniref:hypothetical protein n=1 Tax=Variovorax sp. JS1663 TaxID=1851577 RepID=UPI000B3455FB|nr:hypothetical protein [Variovorax sp. JS1663]OUM00063.1 hypothetical protein A8M77_23035 [Variovorax sp. JS1663]